MKLNIRLFILATLGFMAGVVFQFTDIIKFDDNYHDSEFAREAAYTAEITSGMGIKEAMEYNIQNLSNMPKKAKYMSDGRKFAIAASHFVGVLALIVGFLITGLKTQK